MATGGQTGAGYSLDSVGCVTLEKTYDRFWNDPCYNNGIVVTGNKIIVLDSNACKAWLHRFQDGKLLAVDKLKSFPTGICLINGMEICVILSDGTILMMKVDSRNKTDTIKQTRTLHVKGRLKYHHGIVTFKDKLVVCGWKDDTMCWCIVSLDDVNVVDTIHQICKGDQWSRSNLTVKDTMIYISCSVGIDSPNTGVYGFDIENPSKYKYRYKDEDLTEPMGIAVDQHGFLFVCNINPDDCIYQLTDKCELVSIYRQGIPDHPYAIFADQQDGHLYVICWNSNDIHIYRPQYPGPVIPAEVLKMDTRSLDMYKEALRAGKEKVYNIRVMVVGQYGVGKTTLTRRLLGQNVEIPERNSTDGIDVHIDCSKVSLTTGEWRKQEKNAEQYSRLQRLLKLLNECVPKQEARSEQLGQSKIDELVPSEEHGSGHPQHDEPVSVEPDIDKKVKPTSFQPAESPVVKVDPKREELLGQENIDTIPTEAQPNKNEKKKDAVMEILQLVNENADNLKLEMSTMEYAALAMWDFAGQCVFYTTHQTFLTSRAIYLLVIDLSQQVTDIIKDDECFLDTEGIQSCRVYDLLEIWLNSIHSCAPSLQTGIPPVILVGTHVDKIPKESRQKVIEEYFRKIRYMLKDKPTILHLVDDIAVDNTQHDPNLGLDRLRKRIFELAKKQPHWGEERPARWLPLEQAIMTLKTSGVKVAQRSLVEEINRSQSVRIDDSKELDLFLRFQHEMGTILFFSVEGLREKIILDPQWMIDALNSLITAETFIKQNPAITSKWYEFRKNGKLTHELLDVVWSKESSLEFHDNKDHILLLMEKLNIIARPKSYTQDGTEIEVANYFLAPCMLSKTVPWEVVSPKLQSDMETSSVLCFVFVEQYLPSPIFHRLLAASVAHWPIAKKNSENMIYCGCCVFDLDRHHRLTICFREHVIFVRVTRMGTIEKTPSYEVCIEVREFITMTLTNVIGYLGQSLRFELFIRCPKSDGYGVNCLTPVADFKGNIDVPCHFHDNSHMIISHEMLKFWFQDEDDKKRLRRERRKKLEKKNKKDQKERTYGSQISHRGADSADREWKLSQRDEDNDRSSRRKHSDDGLEKRRHRKDEEDDGREGRQKNREEDNDEEIERQRNERKEKRRHERKERREREEREHGHSKTDQDEEEIERQRRERKEKRRRERKERREREEREHGHSKTDQDEKSKGKDGRDTGIHHSVLRICDSILGRLSKDLISHNWRFFFRELSVADHDLDRVQIDYRESVQEQIYQLLRRLNQRGSLNKTSIIKALTSIERNDLVDKYSKKKFSES